MVIVEIKGEIQVSTTCVVPYLTKPPGFGISPTRSRPSWRSMSRDGAGRVRTRAVHRSSVVPRLLAIGYRLSAIGCRLSSRKEAATGTSRRDIGPGTRDPARRGLDGRRIHPPPCRSFVRSFVRSFRVLTPGFSVLASRLLFSSPFLSFFLHVPATTTRSLGTTPFYEHDLNLSLSTTR